MPDSVTDTEAPTAASPAEVHLASGGSRDGCGNSSGSVTCDRPLPRARVAGTTSLTVSA